MTPEEFIKLFTFCMPIVFLLISAYAADSNHLPATICFSAAMISAAIMFAAIRSIL